MAKSVYVVRTNPSDWVVGTKFDRCVRDVSRRGGAYDPKAVCASTMRRAYGKQFDRLSARGRRRVARANPVQEVIQRNVVAPGHVVLEWIDADDGRWIDAAKLPPVEIGPPRKPGPHLVAPGAQLLMMSGPRGMEIQFVPAVFVRHKHAWSFLAAAGRAQRGTIGPGGKLPRGLDGKSARVARMMLLYEAYEQREHGRRR